MENVESSKKSYMFSPQAASKHGSFIGELSNGEKITFTYILTNPDEYNWPDKRVVGEYALDEVKNIKQIPPQPSSIRDFEELWQNEMPTPSKQYSQPSSGAHSILTEPILITHAYGMPLNTSSIKKMLDNLRQEGDSGKEDKPKP